MSAVYDDVLPTDPLFDGGLPLLKVCGATTRSDVDVLAEAGADLVGLWHGVPDGPADLSRDEVTALAGAARAAGVAPVLVTLSHDVPMLADLLHEAGIRWLQLHAYQPPTVVRTLHEAVPGLIVVKVLHLRAGECVERSLITFYERAGTDGFLLDAVTEDGRIGSTGSRLAVRDVLAVAARLDRPFFLAGGISPNNRSDYDAVATHPGFLGIDVDTAARDVAGRFDLDAVTALSRSWGTAGYREEAG